MLNINNDTNEIMIFENTTDCLKSENSTLYKIIGDDKIPCVKIESGRNNSVIVRISYNQKLINRAKTLPERKWNPKRKYWEIPYEECLISRLQTLFGENLFIYPYFYLLPFKKEFAISKYSRRTIKSYIKYNRYIKH